VLDENNPYRQQVALLLEVLPLVGRERCFALKGGTAINLFIRDMPRLSVDLAMENAFEAPQGSSSVHSLSHLGVVAQARSDRSNEASGRGLFADTRWVVVDAKVALH